MTPTNLLNRLVSDVLADNPAAARAFIARRMGCVGCTFAPFETVTEAALAYGIDPCELAGSLSAAHEPHPGDDDNDDY